MEIFPAMHWHFPHLSVFQPRCYLERVNGEMSCFQWSIIQQRLLPGEPLLLWVTSHPAPWSSFTRTVWSLMANEKARGANQNALGPVYSTCGNVDLAVHPVAKRATAGFTTKESNGNKRAPTLVVFESRWVETWWGGWGNCCPLVL